MDNRVKPAVSTPVHFISRSLPNTLFSFLVNPIIAFSALIDIITRYVLILVQYQIIVFNSINRPSPINVLQQVVLSLP